MEATSSALGLLVIVVLYIAIGGMSAAGSVYLSKLILTAKQEQIFFGLFLIPIAGFYLAFAAHFGNKDAWPLEASAVAVFAVLGLVGIRVPLALIVGYLLHGVWDGIHEFNALAGGSLLGPRQTTSVPLAYGPAIRLSRGPADTPLSFDQGVRLFGPLERLSCRLLEVTASSCLVWIAEGKARIRDKARRAGWGTATKRWGRVCITALLPARIPPSAVAQASNLEDAA